MDASQTVKVSPIRLAHFVLVTSRFAEMRRWYLTVLQAHVQFDNETLAFLTYDQEHHRIALANVPGLEARSSKHAGLHHVAFTYGSIGDLLYTYKRGRSDRSVLVYQPRSDYLDVLSRSGWQLYRIAD